MVSTCGDDVAVEQLAASILPSADVRVESMVFEDDPGVPAWITRRDAPPPRGDYRRALLRAIAAGE
jgi:hypothetical protein